MSPSQDVEQTLDDMHELFLSRAYKSLFFGVFGCIFAIAYPPLSLFLMFVVGYIIGAFIPYTKEKAKLKSHLRKSL